LDNERPGIADGRSKRRVGFAWVSLCAALAVHVVDEALTDFLSVYNPAVRSIRERLPMFPLPTFTFAGWLTGLAAALILLLLLSGFVYRGARWTVPLAYVFSVLMMANGATHLIGSIYLGRLMPGVYSAPLLLAASAFLLVSVRARRQQKGFP
jgi:hypothetical protein